MNIFSAVYRIVGLAGLLFVLGSAARSQTTRTKTVDPQSGRADYQKISDALNDIAANPSVRWTILVYAGTYSDSLSFTNKENVDIVGADREAVIISTTITLAHDNSLRNLTVKPSSGDAITMGADCLVDNVIVQPTSGKGIVMADDCIVSNSVVKPVAGRGIEVDDDCTVLNTSVTTSGSSDDGIYVGAKNRVTIDGCIVNSVFKSIGGALIGGEDLVIRNCQLTRTGSSGAGGGALALGVSYKRALVLSCKIVADTTADTTAVPLAVMLDGSTALTDITLQGCTIISRGAHPGTETGVEGIRGVESDVGEGLKLVDCNILAESTDTTNSPYVKVWGCYNSVTVIGGSITTTAPKKSTDVFDLNVGGSARVLRMSGTRCSKWYGPISAPQGKKSIVQRTLNVATASTTAIHAAITLTGQEETIITNITNPDVYRALTITGTSGLTGNVYIVGTDWGGNRITDKLALFGANTVTGVKPFKTVTKIIVPSASPSTTG